MTTVEIEYCVPCGLLDQAVGLQRALLAEFGLNVDAVSLVTGDGGVFEVHVDGDVIYDKNEEGYDEEAILERVRQRL